MMYIEQAPLGGSFLKSIKQNSSLSAADTLRSSETAQSRKVVVEGVGSVGCTDGNACARSSSEKAAKFESSCAAFDSATKPAAIVNGVGSYVNGSYLEESYERPARILKPVHIDPEPERLQHIFVKPQPVIPAKKKAEEELEEFELVDVVEEETEQEQIGTQTFEVVFEADNFEDEYPTVQAKNTDCDIEFIEFRRPEYIKKAKPFSHFGPENRRTKRPVPGAIPIQNFLDINNFEQLAPKRLLNGCLPVANDYFRHTGEEDNVSVYSYLQPRLIDHKTGFYSDNEPMGIDIFGGIRKLFNWGHNSRSGDAELVESESGKRKRRFEKWATEASAPQIKYRRVESNFPKIITHNLDDDLDRYPVQSFSFSNRQRATDFHNTSLSNIYGMGSHSAPNKAGSRRSVFVPPQTAHRIVRNTPYADVEFSDYEDDDSRRLQYSLGIPPSSFVKQPKVVNIPIRQEPVRNYTTAAASALKPGQQHHATLFDAHRVFSPPAFAPRNLSEIETMMKPTYAEALKFSAPFMGNGLGNVLSGRPISSNASSVGGASTSARLDAPYGNASRISSKTLGRSIHTQEREREEHERYKQLIEQFGNKNHTRSFGTLNTNKKSHISSKYGFGLPSSAHRRAPLSSTINIEDDDDDEDFGDVTITGVTHLNAQKPLSQKVIAPNATITLDDDDDDDISEIIDLGKGHASRKNSAAIDVDAKENKKQDLPYVEPVNSFRDLVNSVPHLGENWYQSLFAKYEERQKLRHAKVNETLELSNHYCAQRRNAQKELQKKFNKFSIVDPELVIVDDFELVEEEPEFPELNHAIIKAAISGPPDQVLVEKFNMQITRRDIHTLLGQNWLNDEVINFYMNLLIDRSEKKHKSHGFPTVYAMNTFFVQRLLQNGHSAVKRWTRKVNLFEKDVIPVPVHVNGVHWCMAIIHLKNRTIRYYDSMGAQNPNVLKALEQYLQEESLDKRKQPFDTSGFDVDTARNIPRQENGSDCGVFSCMFAEYVTRNKEITFSQQHMEYFRHKMILEIVQGELLH